MAGRGRARGGRRGLVVGRVAGIEIRVHPTFWILVALAAVGGFGPPVRALAWLGLLFASVTLHELAHSLVARRRGIPVEGIVLLPIGGVSEMARLPDRPRDELAVAVAGPAASVGVAAVLLALASASGAGAFPPGLVAGPLLRRLGWTNLLLAGFNLLPAFPLDGGRVLRALLAGRMGLEAATRAAAAVGRRIAVALGVAGLLFEPWLVFIAVFVYVGARAEELGTLLHVRLGRLHVTDLAGEPPLVVDAATPADRLGWLRWWAPAPRVPVVAGGRYVGLLDARRLTAGGGGTAGDLADHDAAVLRPDEWLDEAVARLGPDTGPAVPVVDRDGELVGWVVLDDVADLLAAPAGGRRR
jgi:stage IV sporulation protein FB